MSRFAPWLAISFVLLLALALSRGDILGREHVDPLPSTTVSSSPTETVGSDVAGPIVAIRTPEEAMEVAQFAQPPDEQACEAQRASLQDAERALVHAISRGRLAEPETLAESVVINPQGKSLPEGAILPWAALVSRAHGEIERLLDAEHDSYAEHIDRRLDSGNYYEKPVVLGEPVLRPDERPRGAQVATRVTGMMAQVVVVYPGDCPEFDAYPPLRREAAMRVLDDFRQFFEDL